jgi:tRNA U34 5-methylaminomethyl-2-thiouridine-forming methyltransferase MnmC
MLDEPDPTPAVLPLWDGRVIATDDGSATLHSPRYGQGFRSLKGAHAEARHVFLEGSGVGARLRGGRACAVLEIGLGAGTNLGLTAAAAWATGTPLRYRAIEREPLPPAAWAALDLPAWWPPPLAAAWIDALTVHAGRADAADRDGGPSPAARLRVHVGLIALEVVVADVADLVAAGDLAASAPVDAVYLDAFSPAVDPAAWRPEVLEALAACLAPGGALVSYSVRGAVRRALAGVGLDVAKLAGPAGGKREMLRARRPPSDPSAAAR